MATHSSILARKIPWTEEPGGLQFMGSQRVRHDWMTEHTQSNRPGVLIRKENEMQTCTCTEDRRQYSGHVPVQRTCACRQDTHSYRGHTPVERILTRTEDMRPYSGHAPIQRTCACTEDTHPYRGHAPVQWTLTRTEDARLYGGHSPGYAPVPRTRARTEERPCEAQGEGAHLQAKERGLRRTTPEDALIWGFQAS